MSDDLKIVLQKLEAIENRLRKLEGKGEEKGSIDSEKEMVGKREYDPLFHRAWEIILNEENDVSSIFLAKRLDIDVKRAEAIMDQLAEAGFGVCYSKEV